MGNGSPRSSCQAIEGDTNLGRSTDRIARHKAQEPRQFVLAAIAKVPAQELKSLLLAVICHLWLCQHRQDLLW